MRPPVQIGPAPWFRITGDCVREGPSWTTIGTFQNNMWEVGGEHFSSFDVKGFALIQFEDVHGGQSDVFGPFDSIRFADGNIWTDADLFARFSSQTQLWQHVKTNTHWTSVVIKAP